MTHLTNEQIEDAFTQIRVEFEQRNNEYGLGMLDSYEDQWANTGSLSDGQQAWLKDQLDGAWRTARSKRRPNAVVMADPAASDEAELMDAIVERQLAAQGKTLVDAAQIARLKKVISDLDDLLRDIGA